MWKQHVEKHSYLHGERRGCMRNNLLLCLQQNVPKLIHIALYVYSMPYPSEQAEMVAQECSCDQQHVQRVLHQQSVK